MVQAICNSVRAHQTEPIVQKGAPVKEYVAFMKTHAESPGVREGLRWYGNDALDSWLGDCNGPDMPNAINSLQFMTQPTCSRA